LREAFAACAEIYEEYRNRPNTHDRVAAAAVFACMFRIDNLMKQPV